MEKLIIVASSNYISDDAKNKGYEVRELEEIQKYIDEGWSFNGIIPLDNHQSTTSSYLSSFQFIVRLMK